MTEQASDIRRIDIEAQKAYEWFHNADNGKLSLQLILKVGEAETARRDRLNKNGKKMSEERKIIYGKDYDPRWLSDATFIYENKNKIIPWRRKYTIGILDPATLRQRYREFLRNFELVTNKKNILMFKKAVIKKLVKKYENEPDASIIKAEANTEVTRLKAAAKNDVHVAAKLYKSTTKIPKNKPKVKTLPKIGDSDDITENMFKRLKTVLDVAFDPDFISPKDREKVLTMVLEKFRLHEGRDCEFGLNEKCSIVKHQFNQIKNLQKEIKELRKQPTRRQPIRKKIVNLKEAVH